MSHNISLTVGRPLLPSHARIDSATERELYWNSLSALWGVVPKPSTRRTSKGGALDRFPGSNPVSIDRKSLHKLHATPHVVGVKSDGIRYALCLTIRPGSADQPVALMVDRAGNMFEVDAYATEDHFLRGTILEGELVWHQPDEKSLTFLAFDAVAYKGDSLIHKPFEERLAIVQKCTALSSEIVKDPEDIEQRVAETDCIALMQYEPPVSMEPKRFVSLCHAPNVWAERGAHRIDGLIVHRLDAPYVFGKAFDAIYKWKPHHTIDLRGDATALHTSDGPLPATLCGRTVRVVPSRVEAKASEVAEYHIDVASEPAKVLLFALRMRHDKGSPNSLFVTEATVGNALEQLTVEELAVVRMEDDEA